MLFIEGSKMIRHTVLFKIKSDTTKSQIEIIFNELLSLTNQLPGILSITGGTCYFYDQAHANLFTHGFSIDFQDQAARNTFLNAAIVDPIKEKIIEISEGGFEKIIGFDFGEWS